MDNIKDELSKFQAWLREHKDNYEQLLAEAPYCISVKFDNVAGKNLAIFKYSQIDSDFSKPFVKLCRGLILDAGTFDVVSFPFVKFHNYGEVNADDIDWSSCYVTAKLDGSLVKIVRIGNELLVSTNSTIDAYKAPIAEQIGCKAKSFGELVDEAIDNAYKENFNCSFLNPIEVYNWFFYMLDEGKTYMFELTSPFNKIVVAWNEVRLHFIGCRDNETGKEIFFGDHPLSKVFHTPEVFPLRSIDECVAAAEKLDCNAEGYVVVDKNFNRVKVKSPTYIALHHMKNNGVLSFERGVEIVRNNELDEILTYFPEFKEHLEKINDEYKKLVGELEVAWAAYQLGERNNLFQSRKDSAIWIQKNFRIPGVGFSLLDKKADSVKSWMLACPTRNLVKHLGFKLDAV